MTYVKDEQYRNLHKEKREADRAEADRLEQSAKKLQGEALFDGITSAFGNPFGTIGAIEKGVEASVSKKKAQELREKADNAPTITWGKKKKD